MKIILTANAAWNIVNFRRPLIEALLEDGHEVTILAPPDETRSTLEKMGCRFLPLAMDQKGLSPWRDGALILRFWKHFRREKPDVVFSYTIKNNLYGALAARVLGIPFIPNVTGLGTAFLSGRLLRFVAETLYRVAFARVPAVFFQNEDDCNLFKSRGLVKSPQIRMVPGSGIDVRRFTPRAQPEDKDVTFLLIARMLRDKGVVEFVDAARAIKAAHPAVRFELLGPLGYENRSAIDPERVLSWVSEGIVKYHGNVDDVRPYIAAAHCVVLPSYREGTPRTLLEAAAMACPVIASDVPGCRSVVDNGVTGFLCRVRDVESLRNTMIEFLALSQAERAAMGHAGHRKALREFDVAFVVSAYRKVLGDLFGQKTERGVGVAGA